MAAKKAPKQSKAKRTLRASKPASKSKAKLNTTANKHGAAKSKLDHLPRNKDGVVLLSGGNPQIAKADGDAPVQAYIKAMPGWKGPLGKRIDALIVRTVPGVQKAVRWNSPMYGVEGQGWFLTFHVLTRYIKLTFFEGTSLRPMPPGHTERSGQARWIDILEGDGLDEKQLAAWVKQASEIPGWIP